MVEVKCVSSFHHGHYKQTLNYLKCTNCEVALLINFGPKLQIRRFVFRNALKARQVIER